MGTILGGDFNGKGGGGSLRGTIPLEFTEVYRYNLSLSLSFIKLDTDISHYRHKRNYLEGLAKFFRNICVAKHHEQRSHKVN